MLWLVPSDSYTMLWLVIPIDNNNERALAQQVDDAMHRRLTRSSKVDEGCFR